MDFIKLRRFSLNNEIFQIIIAVLSLSFGLTILYKNLSFFPYSLLIVILTYLPHELAHKYSAKIMDVDSEFKIWPLGVLLTLLTPFMGFIFAVPGYVDLKHYYYRRFGKKKTDLTIKQIGLIGLAGPLTNLIFGIILIFFSKSFPLIDLIVRFNFLLAFLNLLPIFPLDGSKVITWNPFLWFIFQILSFAFLLIF